MTTLFFTEPISNEVEGLFRGNEFKRVLHSEKIKEAYKKNLYKKLCDVAKSFTNIKIENDYDAQLTLLSSVKQELTNFFENVIVNDNDVNIKKNRLLLLKFLCKTFDNYLSFAKYLNPSFFLY